MSDTLLSTTEVAKYLGKSTLWVRYRIRRGDLPGYRVGRDFRVRRDELESWVLAHPVTGPAPGRGKRKEDSRAAAAAETP